MRNGFLNSYFGFTRQQRRGLLVLMCFSFVLLLIRIAYPSFIRPEPIYLSELRFTPLSTDSLAPVQNEQKEQGLPTSMQLKSFDPNTVGFEALRKMGLPLRFIKTLLKFRNKGKVFRKKDDLKKIYGITDSLFLAISPYILLPQAEERRATERPQNRKVFQQTKLELNSADSLALLALRGIGPSFAKRILKYRSMLGGFTNPLQLKEVYGFTDDMYEGLKDRVEVDASKISRIHVNSDDFKTINKHPYLDFEQTKKLVNLRRKTKLEAAHMAEIVSNEEVLTKLLPYLQYD